MSDPTPKRPRAVMITGAAGNLGRAVAAAFTGEGRPLVLVGAHMDALESAFPEDSADRVRVAVDLTREPVAVPALMEAVARVGGIGALVATAGGFRMGEKAHEIGEGALAQMMALNVQTLLTAVKASLPGMIDQGFGRIITIGAASAQKGAADMGAYISAKGAVLRLTEALAAENGRHGVTVNCILPSIIDTPENRAAMPKADVTRWVRPEQLAAVIRFLASDEAEAVNGALIPVTGRG